MLIQFDPVAGFKDLGKIYERDMGNLSAIRKGGMRFEIRSFRIEGTGYFSMIKTWAFMGIMKMETLVFTPLEVDMPLMSYDVMSLPGKDIILLEMYDTMLTHSDLSPLEKVKESYAHLPDRAIPPGWSEKMLLPESVDKQGRGLLKEGGQMAVEWLGAYLSVFSGAPGCDREEKRAAVKRYTDGLFSEGGPAVNQFKRMLGEEAAVKLLGEYVFSCDAP